MLLEDYPKDDTEMLCERCGAVCKKPTNKLKNTFLCFNCTVDLMYEERFCVWKDKVVDSK